MDQADLQEVDVHDGLEATLTILSHKLKHTRIDVRAPLRPLLPRVCVYGSELNQVWTNLLDNAIDALGRDGHDHDHHRALARVRASRCGSPTTAPASPTTAQRRVFDPFFTTKAGRLRAPGSGSTPRVRIVRDRHDGDVRLQSRPGETVFTVRLPRAPSRT